MGKLLGRPFASRVIAAIFALLLGMATINLATGWRLVDSGSPIWGVGLVVGVALMFSIRQWRPWRFEMPLRVRKLYIASHGASLALTLMCAANLVPAERWVQMDRRIAHSLEVTSTSVTSAATETKPDEVNTWGTLFAWLLAIVALVIAFVTSWVFSLSREIKEQIDATQAALDQNLKYREMRREHLSVAAIADLLRLLNYVDSEKYHSDHMVIRHLLSTFHHSAALFRPVPAIVDSMKVFDTKRLALLAIFANTERHPEVQMALRDSVAPCLAIYLESLAQHAPMQCEQGNAALAHLGEIARLCQGR